MKYYAYVSVTVVKQLVVEDLTEDEIWECDDLFEHATDEMEVERLNDWEVRDVKPYVPMPGED